MVNIDRIVTKLVQLVEIRIAGQGKRGGERPTSSEINITRI